MVAPTLAPDMRKSGALFLVAIAILVGGWLAWFFVPWPTQAESIVVLVTGLLAVLVAIWTIFSQRAIARRQCTFEHIARLEADRELIEGRVKFRELAKSTGGLVAWAAADKEQTAEFQMIVNRLNEFELIAIGIQRGIIDFELYSRWFKSGTIRAWNDAEDFIKALRRRLNNNEMIFHEFHELVKWLEEDQAPPRRVRWLSWIA